MTTTRNYSVGLGILLVLVLFGAPLFLNLGGAEIENDEAGYSFAVDRILETGDWLAPRASNPSADVPFLEKPPLKAWIVAAPIQLGLLPHDEFGLRVCDVLMGAVVFVYVYLLALRQSNVAGGVSAALILFVHLPVLVLHGFRTNNMEAPLTLAYAGGVFHFLEWSDGGGARRRHAVAVAIFFVLGFMTKFVAAVFLPAIIGLAALAVRPVRAQLVREWRVWLIASAVAVLLIVPWFLYAQIRFGALLWQTMLGTQVYQRFTVSVDPHHIQPWPFYFVQLYTWLQSTGSFAPVAAGAVLVLVRAAQGRIDAVTTVIWFALPLAVMSASTSKLHHYVYPFVPPLAVAGGAAVGFALEVLGRAAAAGLERARRASLQPGPLRTLCRAIAAAAFAVALLTVVHGPIWIEAGGRTLFKNGGMLRPWLVLALFGVLGGWDRLVRRGAVALLVLAALPIATYRAIVPQLAADEPHPIRSASQCVADVQRTGGHARGLAVVAGDEELIHPPYYYFRRIEPWTRVDVADYEAAARLFHDARLPILISVKRHAELVERGLIVDGALASTPIGPQLRLVLPDPYRACAGN